MEKTAAAGPSKRTMEQRHVLQTAAVDGAAWLKVILGRVHHSDAELARSLTDSPLKPFWVSSAQAILFYSFTKSAALVGKASGHGFIVTRLPTSHPTLIKFSAPLFLNVSLTSFGLSLGHSTTCSFVACMNKQFQEQLLLKGRRGMQGLDAAMLCGSSLQDRPDLLTLSCCGGGSMGGTVGISAVQGGMVDLSFAGGSMSVDVAKNAAVYGSLPHRQILDGTVDPPPEMQPLYSELCLIVHQATGDAAPSAPGRVSASLERYSTGLDPDRVLVLNDGSLWKEANNAGPKHLARHSV